MDSFAQEFSSRAMDPYDSGHRIRQSERFLVSFGQHRRIVSPGKSMAG
jgi:hypothetical protein